ncbi:hypothetical protein [Sphingomonas japonica]|uniref:Inner membrane protein n=1 Tax=Sphingomonas japonica TaxID=511662 RepID=A0ABX0TYH6_9SPHN|nr:hypothetical protein [Sphingomonas japonica]NIJ23369.1 hypothetical protein [Sphingomonas japonica]
MSDTGSFDTGRPPRASARTGWIVALLAFLAGLAAMAAGVHYFGERWLGSRSAARGTAVQPQAAAQPTAALPPGTDVASLYAREIQLAQRIQMLEARLANVDSDSRVASTFATRAEGLLVAFAARRALDRGLGLGYIEGQLRERFGAVEPRAVGYVIAASRQPVTLEDLRLALDTLAPDLTSGNADESWTAALRREVSDLVVLRDEGTPSPRPNDRLTRARRMLDAGQVEGALAEVARLPGAERASSWTDAARRYVDARAALNTIETTAIQGGGFAPVPQMPPQTALPAPAIPQSPPGN